MATMLQEQYQSTHRWQPFNATASESLCVLAYRSVAVGTPTEDDMLTLMRAAQSRNKAENVSGVLLYDHGRFFQWLEGPISALERLWDSISHDPRHTEIRVLRQEPISERLFAEWDLQVASGGQVSVEAAVAAMDSSSELLRTIGRPKSVLELSLEDIFSGIVIPRLRNIHGHDSPPTVYRPATATLWHAEKGCGEKLAQLLTASRSEGTRRYVDSLLDQGANLVALYQEAFEPAQRHLGKLWDAELCDDFHLSLGLARLQIEVCRVNTVIPAEHFYKPEHTVLLCPQPQEAHYVGLAMSSQAFDRNGWAVNCECPTDDLTLSGLVHARWFDVLKLSQSGSLRRDTRLTALRNTIDSARAASLNPSLIVMVDGRTFLERPQVYRAVHANAMSASVNEGVTIAGRLLATSRSLTALCQASVA